MFRRLLNARLITAVYAVLLLTATHWPRMPKIGATVLTSDKSIHLYAYFLLAALLVCSLWQRIGSPVKLALAAWGLAAAFGMLDEITQPLTGRQCDFRDWLADISGAALGATLMTVVLLQVRRWQQSRRPR